VSHEETPTARVGVSSDQWALGDLFPPSD
jgi:hypothetical protein